MSEHGKSKSDLNPGDMASKSGESPKKSKRLSLANESCLPKITESGENNLESIDDPVFTDDFSRDTNTATAEHRYADTSEAPVDRFHIDETETIDSDREMLITTDLDSIKRVRKKSFDSESDDDKNGEENDNLKVCHKKVKQTQNVDLEEVNTDTGHTLTTKQSAIDKLVKANSKDILSIIQKIRCVQKKDSEPSGKQSCPHCKPWSPGDSNKPEKCLVCDITNAAEKLTSIDTNRFLVEILYPHDFYDKYSRSRRKMAHIDQNETPVHVPLIKPVKVVRKHSTTRPVVLKMSSNNDNMKLDFKEGTSAGDTKKFEDGTDKPKDDNTVRSRLFGLTEHEKSCMHSKCREGTQAMYEVNSLGMQFALPDYNGSLHHRKPCASRQYNYLTSSAQNPLTPRLFTTTEEGNNRVSPFSRTFHRGLTFAGFDNNVKTLTSQFTSYQREITQTEQKLNPVEVSFKFGRHIRSSPNKLSNSKDSLPPIESKDNSTNVFLTQGSSL